MPKRKNKSKSLLEILDAYNPKALASGQIKMKCPFRDLHTLNDGMESMFLSPDINTYHCFPCKSKGRLTNFLVKEFEVPYFEALDMVHLTEYKAEKKDTVENTDYYWDLIAPNEFLDRKFNRELLLKHRVGMDDDIIVVPMYWNSILRGIKFRQNKPKRLFWYSNGFNKDEYLYNGDKFFKDYVILVEGETDLWRLEMFGLQAYALLGTGMSEWQSKHIAKTKKVFISADCDLPGIKAANDWYKKLHKECDVMFINYPAEDPGACTRREYLHAYNNPASYAEFKLLTD